MRRFLLFFLALPLAAATYEDPAGKFHFDLPSGWTARVQGRLPEETPLTFAKGGFSCDLTVLVQEGGGTIEEARNEIEGALVGQGDVVREEVSVDDAPAARLTLTPDDASLGVTVMLVVVRDEARLVVELRADRDAWRRERAQYDAVLAGFHVGEPEEADDWVSTLADYALRDGGEQIVTGNPPLTDREVSGCLGAIEFAYGIELTWEEMSSLSDALKEDFLHGGDAARQALAARSEQGWKAREAAGDEVERLRKAIAQGTTSGSTSFDRAAARVVLSTTLLGGKPSERSAAVIEEWAAFIWHVVSKGNLTLCPSSNWTVWSQSDDALTDVEWMALRAAFYLASATDRRAYRNRVVTALGDSDEDAMGAFLSLKDADVPALGAKLREAAVPLLETLSPPVDLLDPSRNGAIRYRF